MGAGALHVQLRHVLPHVGPTIATAAALAFGEAVSLEAGLSFLGLGVRPPTPSWGSMVDDGRPFLATAWWTTAVPAACIVLVTLAAVRVSELLEGRPASALRVAGLTGGRDAR
jgi:peptide/nickel transport system permease protein